MALYINGSNFPTTNKLYIDSQLIKNLYINDQLVWTYADTTWKTLTTTTVNLFGQFTESTMQSGTESYSWSVSGYKNIAKIKVYVDYMLGDGNLYSNVYASTGSSGTLSSGNVPGFDANGNEVGPSDFNTTISYSLTASQLTISADWVYAYLWGGYIIFLPQVTRIDVYCDA